MDESLNECKCETCIRLRKLAKCESDCHPAGHYECWKDNCNCICHAARRFLGIARPESYTPVSSAA